MLKPTGGLLIGALFLLSMCLYYLFINRKALKKWTDVMKFSFSVGFGVASLIVVWAVVSIIVTEVSEGLKVLQGSTTTLNTLIRTTVPLLLFVEFLFLCVYAIMRIRKWINLDFLTKFYETSWSGKKLEPYIPVDKLPLNRGITLLFEQPVHFFMQYPRSLIFSTWSIQVFLSLSAAATITALCFYYYDVIRLLLA